MPVAVQCPNPACGKSATVPETHLGRKVRCKHCGETFLAQSAKDTARPAAEAKDTIPEAKKAARSTLRRGGGKGADGDLKQLGRFEIRGHLGSGAFGHVYRAYDPQLDRDVALKVPQPGSMESQK